MKRAAEQIRSRGLRASYQRVVILDYLNRQQSHPTVDAIYEALKGEIPSLSKATVYNTLKALIGAGLARSLEIDPREERFDGVAEDHGHFQCEKCGMITNFSVGASPLIVDSLKGYEVKKKDIYLKGICPGCKKTDDKEAMG